MSKLKTSKDSKQNYRLVMEVQEQYQAHICVPIPHDLML